MQSRVVRPTKSAAPASQKSELDQWPGPSNITTFVRCLRLLDLDTFPDWPSITDNVLFSKTAQQNLQARIKAVEWSLYRLFEIYDSKGTQAKLRPFFPPLAPLQSLNLRAALYRALTELKKNGVLGRDIVLRKTMLDDCGGQKLEEVLKEFALVVLRKACKTHHSELGLDQIEHIPKEQLVPLILAYRLSLQQSLQRRQSISQHTESYLTRLASARTDLQNRLEVAQQDFEPVDEQDLAHFSNRVRSAWVGDDRWCDILLEGRRHSPVPLLQKSFEPTWTGPIDQSLAPNVELTDLAAELDQRISEQEHRLKKWKTFHASMMNTQSGNLQPLETRKPSGNAPCLRFDQHEELRLDSQFQQSAEERLEPYHASVLNSMHNELDALHSFVPSAIAPNLRRDDNHAPPSQAGILDKTPKPVAHHGPSRSRTSSSIISSPQEDNPIITDTIIEHMPRIDMNAVIQEENTNNTTCVDASPLDISHESISLGQQLDSTSVPSSPPAGLPVGNALQVSNLGQEEIATARKVPSSNRTLTSTLQERTRASLLPFTMDVSLPNSHGDPTADDKDDDSQVLPPLPAITASRGTLLERTRQSMSLLPNPPQKLKTSQQSSVKQPRFSEIFPVNQFETPGKSQTQQPGAWAQRSGSSTPRDRLFSEEADYASVFKSRPRIAVSPSLSPERSNLDFDSMLAAGVDELDLGDSDETPSRDMMRNA